MAVVVGLVGAGISVSFSFIRSLEATSFLEDDYTFLTLNSLFDVGDPGVLNCYVSCLMSHPNSAPDFG